MSDLKNKYFDPALNDDDWYMQVPRIKACLTELVGLLKRRLDAEPDKHHKGLEQAAQVSAISLLKADISAWVEGRQADHRAIWEEVVGGMDLPINAKK